jgi:ATP-dependent Lon protease
MLKYPDGSVRILVQGIKRIEIRDYVQYEPYFHAHVAHLQDTFVPSKDLDALQAHMVSQFAKFVSMVPYLPDELQGVVMNIKDPGRVSDLIASNLNISVDEKQDLLNSLEVSTRL